MTSTFTTAVLTPLDSKPHMTRSLAALATLCCATLHFATAVHAQSNAPGPFATPSGPVQFVRADHEFVGMLDKDVFDRFGATALAHFDEIGSANDSVTRSLVQTDSGPVLYDFRQRPPLVQRTHERMAVKRVFWQGDDVVMQGSQGWFSLKGGVLTKLRASKKTYR